MANASFYRLKFGTIDLMTNCWMRGHILTWWQSLSFCLNKMLLLMSEFKQIYVMKVLENYLRFPAKKKKINAFRFLELEICAEHLTMSGLQDRFRLLRCCYNLNLKTTFLNLGLLMKVLGLCRSFLSKYSRSKSKFYSSSYNPINELCSSLDWTSISFLSLAFFLSSQFQ